MLEQILHNTFLKENGKSQREQRKKKRKKSNFCVKRIRKLTQNTLRISGKIKYKKY